MVKRDGFAINIIYPTRTRALLCRPFLYAFTMAGGKDTRVTKRDRSNENFKKKWSTLKNNGLSIHQVTLKYTYAFAARAKSMSSSLLTKHCRHRMRKKMKAFRYLC
ncbi:hypothetical protein B0T17DRAFT_206338 [Bombardia bombarda]|uniref:Uncharacterized protein n=1 Tax=Bombardia bombarda TaxID=252184 RepID=A0AA39X9T6_9PEZI|nr:hypothetical protein B0T17DRAFT_206338 [Bombardia bombarda]